MPETIKKLLLVIPIRLHEDLTPIIESEEIATIQDLLRKTSTSYNTHWNGNYVLDQEEIPWKATEEELSSLQRISGKVVVLSDMKYFVSQALTLMADTDGSVYVLEDDIENIINI